jgi:integrase
MAGVYETELKQEADGTWYRWVGEDQKKTKQKFRLGKDRADALRRLRLIVTLYESQFSLPEFFGGSWVPEYLKAAKQIAKGAKPQLPRVSLPVSETATIQESAATYVTLLAHLNRDEPLFEAESPGLVADGIAALERPQQRNRLIKSTLVGGTSDREATGQAVSQAISSFIDYLVSQYTLPDGSLSPWGKTQIDQTKSWRRFMSVATETRNGETVSLKLLETDLADVTVAKAQQLIDVVRKRPLTLESKHTRRLAVKTCQSIHKVIRHFFDWLDLSDEWQWTEPLRFRKLNYNPAALEDGEKHDQKQKKEHWRISDNEIQILVKHATPSERVLILLGLNCAFGAGEIGNLRIPYVKFESQEIDGIRFKTGNDTRHRLWPETAEALGWELQRREQLPQSAESKDIFFLSEGKGLPLWRRSKAGNYNDGIAKRWNDLIQRVRKEQPNFHQYSFGKLRKTAAIRVIEIADAEAASMILAHGIPSEDKLLSAYVNIPWQKLYAAQEAYGESIRPILKTSRPPFEKPPKNYIGAKAEQILEQHRTGTPVSQIASDLGLSEMTVYRHLKRAGLRLAASED